METRNGSLDLYRILCMFLITTIHIIGYSGLTASNPFNDFAISAIRVLQYFSISGFTLISAYFLVSKDTTPQKIISFVTRLFFFSVIIFFFSIPLVSKLSGTIVLKSFFPVMSLHYWYPVNYLFLLMVSPFLNKLIRILSQKQLLGFIVILVLFISVLFHLSPFASPSIYVGHETHSLLWFMLLYLIAAYIKLYGVVKKILFGPIMFFVCGTLLFVFQQITLPGVLGKINVQQYNSIVGLLFTISSFIIFTNLKINVGDKANKILRFCMPATFVIYLFQEHEAVRSALWNFVNITKWSDSLWLVLIMIGVFAGLFVAALMLEALYKLAHKFFLAKLEKVLFELYSKFEHVTNKKAV